jgi:hypothetical protein
VEQLDLREPVAGVLGGEERAEDLPRIGARPPAAVGDQPAASRGGLRRAGPFGGKA